MQDPSGVARIFRDEWPRLVALLVRDFGDIDLAEEAAQDAFLAAARHWSASSWPDSPGAWLTTTARRKAIDRIRSERRFARHHDTAVTDSYTDADVEPSELVDAQLALLLGCCHPALGSDSQVALTLRVVGGLSTEQVANAFLVTTSTMTRRLTRAKTKIRDAGIPFATPDTEVLVERLESVRQVIYLIFTEGHASTSSAKLIRGDLCDEAIWLAELLASLVPDDPEVRGLSALLLLNDGRRHSRELDGAEVLLPDQDRSLWDRAQIDRGLAQLGAAHKLGSLGPFQLQAAIGALHATAPHFEATDWAAIVGLYDALTRRDPSPVIALNRAIAVSYVDGPAAALKLLDHTEGRNELAAYPYYHSTRAELLAKCGDYEAALEAIDHAIRFSTNDVQSCGLAQRRTSLARHAS